MPRTAKTKAMTVKEPYICMARRGGRGHGVSKWRSTSSKLHQRFLYQDVDGQCTPAYLRRGEASDGIGELCPEEDEEGEGCEEEQGWEPVDSDREPCHKPTNRQTDRQRSKPLDSSSSFGASSWVPLTLSLTHY